MELLASLFVGQPLNIIVVAVIFLAGYFAIRSKVLGSGRHPWPLLVAAAAWVLYSAWEFLVHVRTPEANIRVDILVIWPALAILSAWALYRSLR